MPAVKYRTLKKTVQFKQIQELGTKFVSSSFVLYGLDKSQMGKRKKGLEVSNPDLIQTDRPEQISRSQAIGVQDPSLAGHILIGFTASRRVGNAVKRAFAKRRMRSAVHQVAKNLLEQGLTIDLQGFVIIAKTQILTCNFAQLAKDLEFGLKRLIKKRVS